MDVFTVIADPTRRTMLEMLVAGERAAGELVAAFPNVSQPAISQHLKVLRDSGLVTVRADRQRRFYTLDSAGLNAVRTWLTAFVAPEPTKTVTPSRKPEPKPRSTPTPAPEPVMLDLFG
ncbi:ArsR/SmtB family transcription factor [Pelagibacterium limicola]|uniref:ArsR/SmtB family transcription factor n=1 Tax=Pelagibacterium limicola TaxID=2791022 RepID=UPI0018B00134|nr:metalloregulator ArsR/SmtB family transcription factor [Pelagibacterium limicola]